MSADLDDIDQLMMSDDTIVPSSGFTGGVMDAVRAAAEAPAPLRFPWGRFALGVAACLVWAAAGIAVLTRLELSLPLAGDTLRASESWQLLQATTVAAVASVAVLRLQRMVSRR